VKTLLSTFILLTLFSQSALAETRYVTDVFRVTLRSGKSTQNEIIRMVPSGLRLEVLETDKASGYSRVRMPSGKEGWILTRYLMELPSARARLSRAETKLANTEQAMNQLKTELQTLTQKKNELARERNRLNGQSIKLSRKLSEITRVSSNAIQLSNDHSRLKKRLTELDRDMQFLQQENANLRDRNNRDWFIVGALVVIGSMIFGIILTRIRWKKKSNWGDIS